MSSYLQLHLFFAIAFWGGFGDQRLVGRTVKLQNFIPYIYPYGLWTRHVVASSYSLFMYAPNVIVDTRDLPILTPIQMIHHDTTARQHDSSMYVSTCTLSRVSSPRVRGYNCERVPAGGARPVNRASIAPIKASRACIRRRASIPASGRRPGRVRSCRRPAPCARAG